MLTRLAVRTKGHIDDVQGRGIADRIRKELKVPVDSVSLIKIYTLDGLSSADIDKILDRFLLHDPVLHEVSCSHLAKDFDWIIEVGFRPGVTDNEARVAQETIRTGLNLEAYEIFSVYTSVQYALQGCLSREEVEHIAKDFLSNQLIEQCRMKTIEEWRENPGFEPVAPKVTGVSTDQVDILPVSQMDDTALQQLSQERVLVLSLEELRCIQKYYLQTSVREARQTMGLPSEPTDVELEVLAQTWSEHCKHKIFNALISYENNETGHKSTIDSLFKTYIQKSTETIRDRLAEEDFCLSVFVDNAGVIRFDEEVSICIKVETHNSPSALDPYGGALTGIVGVNRDPLGTGLGANLICNTDVFCFASPFHNEPLPPRLLHPRRVLEGVRQGVEHGGNQSGIPTVNGGLVFDERYLGKPLVFCGTVGSLPAQINGLPSHEKKASTGDKVVMVGGRVGKDGIHGATFSSEALHAGSPATAVQIGDPITQRKMYDFLMQARYLGLYSSITDNGAGGLSSSVGEMAEDTGGCELDVACVPLKYDGLAPWEILLSEAQERMTLAVPETCLESFLQLANQMDVEATVLGEFTNTGYFRVWYKDAPVAALAMPFLHHGLPQMRLQAVWEQPPAQICPVPDWIRRHPRRFLRRMLGRLNICSREYIIRQYDHEVQGGSVIKSLVGSSQEGPSDAAVIRPVLDKRKGLVISNGLCPRYSDLDTYWMMACAIDEAIRNAVAVGGNLRHMAGVDNFCWCDPVQSERTPDGHYKLAQLVRANQALAHFCQGYGVPCISGKDSMKNDYFMEGFKISIPPTVLFSVISVVPAVERCLSSDFKKPGDGLYILGMTKRELGRSEFAAEIQDRGGEVPQVDLLSARERYLTFYQVVQEGLVNACHDISDGGLAVALAEMAIGGGLGAEVHLDEVPVWPEDLKLEEILYSETASRLVVTVPREGQRSFERRNAHQVCQRIGEVKEQPKLTFFAHDERYLQDDLDELNKAWKGTLDW
jgi:phosphoribosylformylglycinamidine synthase